MADEPLAIETASQTTPRLRGKDLGEGPLGSDDLVTIGNIHRLVTHEMIYTVFPATIQFGQESRLFMRVASRSRIRVMRDCTSAAMVDAVPEGFPVHYPDYFRCHGTPVKGLLFEFSLGFVKLLYLRAVLGRRVDFARSSGPEFGRTPPLRSLYREAVWNWIERAPAAMRRLGESDGVEARLERELESQFQTRLAEAEEGTRQAEEALGLANLVVADLTSSAATLDAPRIQELRAELLQKEEQIGDLLLVKNGQRTNIAALRRSWMGRELTGVPL
ncbi:hypothetical protein R1sor_000264 [Riccia sorocarpa]|uniref:Uncharacterized protein n=1 Tax=Riccia sorocarpa TaxID=122646 RepID=A0ABD3GUZ7_9MARC